jgi:hypothetical protein
VCDYHLNQKAKGITFPLNVEVGIKPDFIRFLIQNSIAGFKRYLRLKKLFIILEVHMQQVEFKELKQVEFKELKDVS